MYVYSALSAGYDIDQPGMVAVIPAPSQLNRDNVFFSLSPFAAENLVS